MITFPFSATWALIACSSVSACQSPDAPDKAEAQCEMEVQKLYPKEYSNLNGASVSYMLNCMRSKGYRLDLSRRTCVLDEGKDAIIVGGCYG